MLYLLDPDIEFAMLESIARTMVNYDTIEPFIIVGIGYQNQDLATMNAKEFLDQWTKNRARDYILLKCSKAKKILKVVIMNIVDLAISQLAALAKKKEDDVACGEIETHHPGYLSSQDTFYVGTLKGVGKVYLK